MSAPDDPTIAASDRVLRRIVNNPHCVTYDGNLQRWVPRTGGFAIDDDGVSVYLERVLAANSLGPADVAAAGRGVVAAVVVRNIREAEVGVMRDPIEPVTSPIDPAHALMTFAPAISRNRRKRNLKQAIEHAEIVWGESELGPLQH